MFGFIVKNTFGKIFEKPDGDDTKKMTPFQATTTALASTVGMACDVLMIVGNACCINCSSKCIKEFLCLLKIEWGFYSQIC